MTVCTGSRKIKSGNRSAPSSATSTTSKDGLSGTSTLSSAAKFCSDKCKHNKPSKKPGTLDRTIEDVLFLLLQPPDNPEWKGYDFGMMMQACEKSRRLLRQHHSDLLCPSDIVKLDALPFPLSSPSFLEDIKLGASEDTGYRSHKSFENNDYHKYDLNVPNDTRRKSTKKGDHRLTIPCSLVESIVFNRMADVNRRQGRTRAKRLDKMLDLRRLDLKPPTNASSKIWNLYKEADEQYLESQQREEKEGQVRGKVIAIMMEKRMERIHRTTQVRKKVVMRNITRGQGEVRLQKVLMTILSRLRKGNKKKIREKKVRYVLYRGRWCGMHAAEQSFSVFYVWLKRYQQPKMTEMVEPQMTEQRKILNLTKDEKGNQGVKKQRRKILDMMVGRVTARMLWGKDGFAKLS